MTQMGVFNCFGSELSCLFRMLFPCCSPPAPPCPFDIKRIAFLQILILLYKARACLHHGIHFNVLVIFRLGKTRVSNQSCFLFPSHILGIEGTTGASALWWGKVNFSCPSPAQNFKLVVLESIKLNQR